MPSASSQTDPRRPRRYSKAEKIAYDEGWIIGAVMGMRLYERLVNPEVLEDEVRELAERALTRIEEMAAERE